MVYVQAQDGTPLMPTTRHGRVRRLLERGEARVVQTCPFTIRLLRESKMHTDPAMALGVDPGYKAIGLSVTTEEQEYYAADITLRSDVVDNISTRRQARRARRSRKKRYRQARFNNRKREDNWIAPSVSQRIHSHEKAISDVMRILPVKKIIIEIAAFDIQKIKNPDIKGKEYQQGEQLDSWNVREYVLFRDGHICQHCKGKSKDKVITVHHIESRKIGGEAPNNLITLCAACHDTYHDGKITLEFKRGRIFREGAFMGIMRWRLFDSLKETCGEEKVTATFGYITKHTRITAGLEKSHIVDARCISGRPNAQPAEKVFIRKCVRTKNRQIHKFNISKGSIIKANQSPKYVFGYQLFDKVKTNDGRVGFVFGRRASGSFDVRTLAGEKISAGISYKKLSLLRTRESILTETVNVNGMPKEGENAGCRSAA